MSDQERTSEVIRAEATAAVEKIEDDLLAKLFEPAAPAPAAVAPAEKNTAPDVRSDAGAESESGKGLDVGESDADLAKAYTALKLDQVPPAVLAKLDRAEVLEWASKAKERQTKTAQELQARTERIRQLEASVVTKASEAKSPTAQADGPDELAEIREKYGDELAAPLAKLLEKRQQENDGRIALLSGLLEKQLVTAAKANLRESFPKVDDPAEFAELLKEVPYHIGKYRDAGVDADEAYTLALRSAARDRYFDEVQASNAGKALASYRTRMSSQPTPPTGKPVAPKAMTAAEREDALLNAIFSGDNEAKERLMQAG